MSVVEHDYYSEFIDGSRPLRREEGIARTEWFNELKIPSKDEVFFKFEMLIKGLVCFGNPANITGEPKEADSFVTQPFKVELDIVASVLKTVIESGNLLAEKHVNTVAFQRYVESMVIADHARAQLAKKAINQDTPVQSLVTLLSNLQNLRIVVDALVENENVTFQLFTSVVKLVQREVQQSHYFDPLASLEFCGEFDRIKNLELLKLNSGIKSDPCRRVCSMFFLSVFRLMRYLDLLNDENVGENGIEPIFIYLALLRSDSRALSEFLINDSAVWMSEGFGRMYEGASPAALSEDFAKLKAEFGHLISLRSLLNSVGNQLRLELKKAFEQQLSHPQEIGDVTTFLFEISKFCASFRSFLQNLVVVVLREFYPELSGDSIFIDFTSNADASKKLRRDIWMFQQILRAFISRAHGSADAADQWSQMSSFKFVQEFVVYFKSMGYQLIRYSDYAHFDKFVRLVSRLQEGDVLEVQRINQVVEECNDFGTYLQDMFESVSNREDMKNVPFDKKEAAQTLKLFLGH